MILKHRTRRARRGLTLVETAIVIGLVLLMLFGLYEYGRFVMVRQVVQNAAREGARLAVVSADRLTTSDLQNTVTNYLAGQQIGVPTISIYWADPNTGANLGQWDHAAFGQGIAVEIIASYQPVLPQLLKMQPTIPLRVKIVTLCEAN